MWELCPHYHTTRRNGRWQLPICARSCLFN